MDNIGIKR